MRTAQPSSSSAYIVIQFLRLLDADIARSLHYAAALAGQQIVPLSTARRCYPTGRGGRMSGNDKGIMYPGRLHPLLTAYRTLIGPASNYIGTEAEASGQRANLI